MEDIVDVVEEEATYRMIGVSETEKMTGPF